MLQDETISNKLKLSVLIWTILFSTIIIYYSVKVKSLFSPFNLWQTMMLIYQSLSWLCILCYTLSWSITVPSEKLLTFLKLFLLILSGPFLLLISFYAFYREENLHLNIYVLSFLVWWLMFTVSIYSLFKLTLELSLKLQRRSRRRKLTAHYKMVDMKSVV